MPELPEVETVKEVLKKEVLNKTIKDVIIRYDKILENIEPKSFIEKIEKITGKKIICTIEDAEKVGPKNSTDVMVIAPCSR